jgi:hypothetical protein
LEITTEITKEEYTSFVKDYYLKKDWTKWVAILVIVALVISVSMAWSNYGRWNYWSNLRALFSVVFLGLALVFFALPYGVAYYTVRMKIKKEPGQTGPWVYQITNKCITTNKNGTTLFYPWSSITKVKMLADLIVFISVSDDLLIFPIRSLPDESIEGFLQLINGYHVFKTVLTKEKGIN